MALPVVPHRLTKIRAENRVRLVRSAFLFTICAVVANVFSVCTNEWLHTSEVLKYFVFPNRTADEEQNPPTYFKVSRNLEANCLLTIFGTRMPHLALGFSAGPIR